VKPLLAPRDGGLWIVAMFFAGLAFIACQDEDPTPTSEVPNTTVFEAGERPYAALVATPGSFCDEVGLEALTDAGTPLVCLDESADGEPYDQPRWRAP
jgi:hypothetical protein